jgi:hypothetical protein
MRTRAFRARVEGLESRAVPSTSLRAHGTGAVASQVPIPNGSYETLTNLKGISPALGAFKVQLINDFAPDQFHILRGQAIITDQADDEILAAVSGAYQVPLRGATHTSAHLRLTVVGGTGPFANATGAGHLDLSQNVSNGNVNFSMGGVVV